MQDYKNYTYIVNGVDNFDLTTALRLWKTKYEDDVRDFHKEVITHERLKDFGQFVQECWDDIQPYTTTDAFNVQNVEVRRVYFDAIGTEKLFKSLDPKLLDKQTITKKRTKWDDNNDPTEYVFEDVYELYQIEGSKLFGDSGRGGSVYAVRCWCTTTNREYWLYVPQLAATGERWNWSGSLGKPDAIRAIAWTIRIDINNPERIYRQGDIIVVKKSKNSVETSLRHLDKGEYLDLMYSET
jgi:hypothetical protein